LKECEDYKKAYPFGEILAKKDQAFWLKDMPQKDKNRPMNEMAGNLSSWESVLGWKV
jgi:hypothetical protein